MQCSPIRPCHWFGEPRSLSAGCAPASPALACALPVLSCLCDHTAPSDTRKDISRTGLCLSPRSRRCAFRESTAPRTPRPLPGSRTARPCSWCSPATSSPPRPRETCLLGTPSTVRPRRVSSSPQSAREGSLGTCSFARLGSSLADRGPPSERGCPALARPPRCSRLKDPSGLPRGRNSPWLQARCRPRLRRATSPRAGFFGRAAGPCRRLAPSCAFRGSRGPWPHRSRRTASPAPTPRWGARPSPPGSSGSRGRTAPERRPSPPPPTRAARFGRLFEGRLADRP
mmetsp:Transcript_70177/g.141352  ORF Transcript_70177/g.141352 Transcript_70177/m.141352 type:complete len:285 (+) Transcript_70177:286-1140(+)